MSRAVRRVGAFLLVWCVCCGASAQALALPEGRAYEQVSPVYKGGYGALAIWGVEPHGEGVVFLSPGAFAGAPLDLAYNYYQASRSGTGGWSTVSLNPPPTVSAFPIQEGFSPSLDSSLWLLPLGEPTTGTTKILATDQQYAVHRADAPDTEAGFQLVGPVLKRVDGKTFNLFKEGVSDDFCHILVGHVEALLPEAVGAAHQLYDVAAGCHGEPPSLRLVALNNAGGLISRDCHVDPGSDLYRFNAISADGSEVFFTALVPNCLSSGQLFVRLGGARTLEVSRPVGEEGCSDVPCPGAATRPRAEFRGASEDGSRVFFTTTARLDGEDKDAKNDLYMAKIGCPGEASQCQAAQREVTSLVQVSHDPTSGEAAEVQGVVRIAPDGSRVYFLARGVLTSEGPNTQGAQRQPVKGADNLYVYDAASKKTAFVGDLCSGPGLSGAVEDPQCPTDLEHEGSSEVPRNDTFLWSFPFAMAQTAGGDGRFLVFSTYAQLITSGPQADTDNAQDVYRYDAQTGVLERVSLGEAGRDSNGNRNDVEFAEGNVGNADARIQPAEANQTPDEERKVVRRAISEDGSRIVFTTADPLSPDVSNGLANVYEWHDGGVSLISTGSAVEADTEPVITPSGHDVFFNTVQGLVPQDTDGERDVYDARIGGGFPRPLAERQQCSGDACQGPLTNPAPLLVPGSVSQAPGENLPPPNVTVKKKTKPKKKAKVKRKAKRAVRARRGARTANRGRGRR